MTIAVGLAGLGSIGGVVAAGLDQGIPGLRLVAVASRQSDLATRCSRFVNSVRILDPVQLARACDVVVECAPAAAFREIATPVLEAGKTLLTVSGAALLENLDLVEAAAVAGGRIILATGALVGLDAVRAAREGEISSAQLVTRKPPQSLASARFVIDHGIELAGLEQPLLLFSGTAREGARAFPANANVVAALALAGIGSDRTHFELWADPTKSRNCHRVIVESDSARFTVEIENVPDADNPGTSRIAALSLLAAVRSLTAPLRVGS
ncbi:aspartate dehydrogenase [Phenylobacterium sp.]|jgi:aspartate dehydrogenase|uniref:aspartate dehydrogenase n=1 Tax=Phenylobacterium sp. TaxID=1871053 RepID=UPI0037CBC69A